jgi:hypothetical protein
MVKRIVELVKTGTFDPDGRLYRVVKLTNTVEPSVGEHMNGQEIKDLIRRPGWTVIIKEGRE